METLTELDYLLFLFWILSGICVLIFFVRKARYKEPDISEYYKLINQLNDQKDDDLKLLHQRNKEIDKIEEEILKCKKELGIELFNKYKILKEFSMKKIISIIAPSLLMLLLIYIWKDGKDILNGIYIAFPLIYIVIGLICNDLKKELLISLILLSLSFLIPINLMFNM